MVLKNYKYTKSLFLNILRCNHLPTKTKKKKKKINAFFFLIPRFIINQHQMLYSFTTSFKII